MKFWLLTQTLNQVLRLAIWRLFEEEEEEEEQQQQQQQQQQASAEAEYSYFEQVHQETNV